MAWNRRRFAVWACVAGATLAVGIVTTALAGKGLKTKSQTTEVDPLENGTATAKCKKGTRAVSGGFDGPGFDPTGIDGPAVYAYVLRAGGETPVDHVGVELRRRCFQR
jgi:hypothetical protein